MATDQELRLRHLADIQAIINRLAQNSFTVKGWSVTLVSVVFAILATKAGARGLLLVPTLPAIVFWGIDAYYLRLERLYRRLYQAAAAPLTAGAPSDGADPTPFDMDVSRYRATVPNFSRTLVTPAVATIPVVLIVLIITYTIAIH